MNIIENRKKFFLLSLVIILIGFGAMAVNQKAGRGALNWDVEFTGGTSMEIDMGEAYETEELETILTEVTGQTAPQIQQIMGTNAAEIKLQSIDGPTSTELMQAVNSESFRMYWQPNQYRTEEENLAYATLLPPYTTHIHVFNWKEKEKYPLREAKDIWSAYLACFGNNTLLLEFMPDGKLEALETEAAALKEIVG